MRHILRKRAKHSKVASMKRTCPACGANLRKHDEICPTCGTSLYESQFTEVAQAVETEMSRVTHLDLEAIAKESA